MTGFYWVLSPLTGSHGNQMVALGCFLGKRSGVRASRRSVGKRRRRLWRATAPSRTPAAAAPACASRASGAPPNRPTTPSRCPFTEFYWVLPGFTRFYRVLPGFNRVSPDFTGFYLVLLDYTAFIMGFT